MTKRSANLVDDGETAPNPWRALLAVELAIVRQALRALLENAGFEVIEDSRKNSWAARVLRRRERPSVVILEESLGRARVGEIADACRRVCPPVPWVVLAEPDADSDAIDLLRAGARGYLLKNQPGTEMIQAIASVLRGGLYLNPSTCSRILPRLLAAAQDCDTCLNSREHQLLRLIAEGKGGARAAEPLGLSAADLARTQAQLQAKLGIRGTAGLVRYAVRHGIVAP